MLSETYTKIQNLSLNDLLYCMSMNNADVCNYFRISLSTLISWCNGYTYRPDTEHGGYKKKWIFPDCRKLKYTLKNRRSGRVFEKADVDAWVRDLGR
jgi:hypothetical protein